MISLKESFDFGSWQAARQWCLRFGTCLRAVPLLCKELDCNIDRVEPVRGELGKWHVGHRGAGFETLQILSESVKVSIERHALSSHVFSPSGRIAHRKRGRHSLPGRTS